MSQQVLAAFKYERSHYKIYISRSNRSFDFFFISSEKLTYGGSLVIAWVSEFGTVTENMWKKIVNVICEGCDCNFTRIDKVWKCVYNER